jgi:hypothetical protein
VDIEIREKMVVAFDKLVRVAGASSFEEGMRQAEALTGLLSNWILFANGFIRKIQTIEELRQTLDSQMSLPERDQILLLAALQSLPQILRLGITAIAEKAVSTLPPPRGGRKRILTAPKAQEMLDFISKLNRVGTQMKVAKKRAAERFGCSLRTVQRLWANRESVPSEAPPTIQVLLSTILKEVQSDGWQVPVDS